MFHDLIESKPRKERSFAQSVGSAVVHVVVIAVAVNVSRGAAESVSKELLPEVVFLKQAPPPPPPPTPDRPPPDVVHQVSPVPQGFLTLVPPKEIPTTIPPVDLTAKFDQRDYTKGIGVPGGTPDGLIGGSADLTKVMASESYTSDQVDDPVQILKQTEPRYPSALRVAGITGTVVLQFVVGTDGKAELPSIQVISTANERFNDAAIETIRASLFKPAKIRGLVVRQLVRQSVNFEIRN